MNRLSSLIPTIVLGVTVALGGSSCQRLKNLKQRLSSQGKSDAEAAGLAITQEQLESSDAAVGKYVQIWEKLEKLLIKVHDEESALKMRKQMDLLAIELREVKKGVIVFRDQEDLKKVVIVNDEKDPKAKGRKRVKELDATVYWYVLAENKENYERRLLTNAHAILNQLRRITRRLKEKPVIVDIVHSGVIGVELVDEEQGQNSAKKDSIKPMPKDWLPPGVTRE